MDLRVQQPGHYATAACGRVYLIGYQQLTTVAIEAAVWADYLRHREAVGGRTLVLVAVDHPPLPLPSVEVRALWRESMRAGSGVDGFAVIGPGLVGLAVAAITNLFEHLIEPRLGIRYRVFTRPEPAVAWLAGIAPLQCGEAELLAGFEAVRAREPAPRA